jgi:hypothetical protein
MNITLFNHPNHFYPILKLIWTSVEKLADNTHYKLRNLNLIIIKKSNYRKDLIQKEVELNITQFDGEIIQNKFYLNRTSNNSLSIILSSIYRDLYKSKWKSKNLFTF